MWKRKSKYATVNHRFQIRFIRFRCIGGCRYSAEQICGKAKQKQHKQTRKLVYANSKKANWETQIQKKTNWETQIQKKPMGKRKFKKSQLGYAKFYHFHFSI